MTILKQEACSGGVPIRLFDPRSFKLCGDQIDDQIHEILNVNQ